MDEMVKYHDYINSLKFTGFTSTDFNFLIVLCASMKDKGVNSVTFNFAELRDMANYKKSNSIKQFAADLKRMNEKLMKITCSLVTEKEIIMFSLFPTFVINSNEQTLTVFVNEKFKPVLNELVNCFTHFELKEYISLESKYSKSLYRLLKQYNAAGIYEVAVDDFKAKMDCPESYNNKQFMQNIINPAVRSLQDYFQNLQCKAKYANKRGKPVTGYIFTFTPEKVKNKTEQAQCQKNQNYNNNKNVPDQFTNFPQRSYDYDALEKEFLNRV